MSYDRFPYVVADLDNHLSGEQTVTACQSNRLVLVLRMDFTSARNARRLIDFLVSEGLEHERLRVVVNRAGEHREFKRQDVERMLGLDVHQLLPEDPRLINQAMNSGIPVVRHKPRARFSREVSRLAASLNGESH